MPRKQVFSYKYVEKKRYHRTLTAVINGMTVADALRAGLIESSDSHHERYQGGEEAMEEDGDEESLFVPEATKPSTSTDSLAFGSDLNPQASSFTPGFGHDDTSSTFGRPTKESSFSKTPKQSTFGQSPTGSGGFGTGNQSSSFQHPPPEAESTFPRLTSPVGFDSGSSSRFSKAPEPIEAPSSFGQSTPVFQPQRKTPGFGGFGIPAAPSASTFGQAGQAAKIIEPFSFAASPAPSTLTSARPTQEQPKAEPFGFRAPSTTSSQPAAPVTGFTFGQLSPAPSTSTSAAEVPFKPLTITKGKC